MKRVIFCIKCSDFAWINGSQDDPEDLCSHGIVTVEIGEERLSYDCCTSAAALRMLRTLTQEHEIEDSMYGEQILPCCGFNMYADDTLENVFISGCSSGVDYAVHHQGGDIVLTTEDGKQYEVGFEEYRTEVLAFACEVEAFYKRCAEKKLPEDEYERNGYQAFWNEWNRRMASEEARQALDSLSSRSLAGTAQGSVLQPKGEGGHDLFEQFSVL